MQARRQDCLILEDGTVFHINDIVEVFRFKRFFKCKIAGIKPSEIIFDCSKEFDSHFVTLSIGDFHSIKLISRKENIYD